MSVEVFNNLTPCGCKRMDRNRIGVVEVERDGSLQLATSRVNLSDRYLLKFVWWRTRFHTPNAPIQPHEGLAGRG